MPQGDDERKKRTRNFAIFSTIAFAAISWLIVILLPPFKSTQANLAVAAGFAIFYLLLISVLGKRTYDPAILITIILLLFCLLIPTIRRAKEREERTRRSSVTPQLRWTSTAGPCPALRL